MPCVVVPWTASRLTTKHSHYRFISDLVCDWLRNNRPALSLAYAQNRDTVFNVWLRKVSWDSM